MAESIGGDIEFTVGGTAVTKLTDVSLSLNSNMIEANSKDSSFAEYLAGKKNASLSAEGQFDQADSASLFQFVDAVLGDTKISWEFTRTDTPATGEVSKYAGDAYISELSIEAPDDETMTVSASIDVTGAVTQTTAI